jgi:hypothetical protein
MSGHDQGAIMIVGEEPPSEAMVEQASAYGEVFVLARTVPDQRSRWFVDETQSYDRATRRLQETLRSLAAGGVRAQGIVGDPDARAARRDALALFPGAAVVLEAA